MEEDAQTQLVGLTQQEVDERVAAGKFNADADVKTKTIPRIFRDNICTFFNLVNLILAILIAWTGSYRNLLFLLIIIGNIIIGIFQEIRSKQTIDRLSVMTETKAHVIRDGVESDIALAGIVLDDVVHLQIGDQVPSDCELIEGRCSANESLLTGESDLITKQVGDKLLSGSFIASGEGYARVVAVGEDNYAASINNEVKVTKTANSEIMNGLNRIIKIVTVIIIPLGILLFCKQVFMQGSDINSGILNVSAALLGMIPQGLILLTSAVLAVSVLRLAQHHVLVQELYCVETLARVDTVCLDKTGTITTGEMVVDEVIPLEGIDYDDAIHSLVTLTVGLPDDNVTSKALKAYIEPLKPPEGVTPVEEEEVRVIPFSSEHKYSGACFGSTTGNYAIGAAEFVLRDQECLADITDKVERLAGVRRVLVLAKVEDFDVDDCIIGEVTPLALVFIRDCIRPTAKETLSYFTDQGVRINIISGDSPETVSNIAASVEVPDADKCVDMSTIETDEDIARVARDCRVFGRVTPEQKRKLVTAMQDQGHTVAMTGDGVNDVLALHQSDCSVAMGSGSDAARNVAQLVLMDDDFSSMPAVVAEGRRSINNLQRSAALFLVKTLFSAVLSLIFLFVTYDYPFQPIQLTLIDAFTIGLPSFVLALEPNKELIRGEFLRNAFTKAIPGATAVVIGVVLSVITTAIFGLDYQQFSTMSVILTIITGVNFVIRLSIPFNWVRTTLLVVIILGLLICIFPLSFLFMLAGFQLEMTLATLVIAVIDLVAFNLLYNFAQRVEDRYMGSFNAE